jgi:citronellyl-CoA dehydrogenase
MKYMNLASNMLLRPMARSTNSGQRRLISRSAVSLLKFGPEHESLRATTRKIIENDINPYVDQWEKEGMFDGRKLFKTLGNAGLLGLTRDPAYGGQGLDYSFVVCFHEELGSKVTAAGVTTGIGVHTEMTQPALARFGSDFVKKEFLTPTIAGDYISCVGVSEPEGGSDVAAIRTTAKKSGDDYIINGGKIWTTNGYQADWMCLLANTSTGSPHQNKSLFCLPLATKGVKIARKIPKLGLHSSDMTQTFFEDVRIPASYMIGEEGMGFVYQMLQFQDERLCALMPAYSGAETMINGTIDYCRQRHTFGKPLIQNQHIHFKLAELMAEVESLRSLTYRAADLMIEGEDVTYLASIGKLKAGRLVRQVSDQCLQFWGGMGYTEESLVARAYRDSRALSIAGGGDEIMLGIIAKFMDILPKKEKNK